MSRPDRNLASVLLASHVALNLAIFRRALIRRLLAEGVAVTCAVPPALGPQDHGHIRTIASLGARVEHYDLSRGSLNPWGMFRAARSLGRVADRVAPDLVHSFTHQPNILTRLACGARSAAGHDLPVVNSVTGLGSMFLGRGPAGAVKRLLMSQAYARTCRRCRAVVFQNPDDREFFTAQGMLGGPEAARTRTALIRGTGVDTRRFAPQAVPAREAAALRKGLGITSGSVVVTLAGRLLRDKGVAEFLEAADLLAPRFPEAVFLLVGEPDPGNPSDLGPAVMEAAGQRTYIRAPGWREDMPLVWAASDVAVLPSYREGLPVTMQEALASGLPAVVTDAPGCREVVDEGKNGFLVPPRDGRALAEALAPLLADEDLRRTMGRAGRDKAMAEFDADVLAGQMLALYRDLLRSPPEAS